MKSLNLPLKLSVITSLLLLQTGALFAAFPLLRQTERCLPTNESRWDNADTIRICALRVEFQPDELTGTSGTGLMADSAIFPDSLIIDGLPHDNQYFLDHVAFVRNYYTTVSHGRTQFGATAIYPANDAPPLRLNYPMWHYNYNTDQDLLNQKLIELFVHSIWKADSAGVPLEQYNAFVIFHAGIGKDFSIGFDNTPFDIPSAYISTNDLTAYRSTLPASVTRGIILPEGENQVETLEFGIELSLNGIAVKLFGNWLGLPDLFNTSNGSSGIGRWGMMDQGSGNINALVPAMPDAWSRVYMGWVEPQWVIPSGDTAVARTTYRVGRFESASAPEVLKIPVTPREYYLIENRDADADSIGFVTLFDRLGRQMRVDRGADRITLDPAFETPVRADHYDFGIPGSGILVWHIDEDVIEANLEANRVNANADHRGVDLVEADGSQDIGREFGFASAGSGTELGIQEDAWWNGNRTHRDANNNAVIRFTDRSHPSAKLYDGASTFLELTNFSAIADTMSFRARVTTAQPGFPLEFQSAADWRVADPDGDGRREVYFMERDSLYRVSSNGTVQVLSYLPNGTLFSEYMDPVDIDGDGADDVLISGADSTGYVTRDDDGHADSVYWTDQTGASYTRLWPAQTAAGVPQLFYISCYSAECQTNEVDIYSSGFKHSAGLDQLTLQFADRFGPLHVYNVEPLPASTFLIARAPDIYCVQIQDTALRVLWSLTDNRVTGTAAVLRYPDRTLIFLSGYGYVSAQNGALICDTETCGAPQIDWNGDGIPSGGGEGGHSSAVRDEDLPHFNSSLPHRYVDLDASGDPDVVLFESSRVYCYQHQGRKFDDFPLAAAGVAPESRVFTMDSTTTLYYIGEVAANNRYYYALHRIPIVTRNRDRFPYQQDAAIINIGAARPQANNREDWVYCWPNPASDVSHIRVTRPTASSTTATIFDLAGRKVAELSGASGQATAYELEWNVRDVESGVYVGRIEVTGGGSTESSEIKIAVVR